MTVSLHMHILILLPSRLLLKISGCRMWTLVHITKATAWLQDNLWKHGLVHCLIWVLYVLYLLPTKGVLFMSNIQSIVPYWKRGLVEGLFISLVAWVLLFLSFDCFYSIALNRWKHQLNIFVAVKVKVQFLCSYLVGMRFLSYLIKLRLTTSLETPGSF